MCVVSPHWSQLKVLRSYHIHLLLFSLVWAVTVYAQNDGDFSPKVCYIGDEGCKACDTCVNPETKDECACVLLFGKPFCDMQCVSGKRSREKMPHRPKIGPALLGASVFVVLGLTIFTLYYWWKVCIPLVECVVSVIFPGESRKLRGHFKCGHEYHPNHSKRFICHRNYSKRFICSDRTKICKKK